MRTARDPILTQFSQRLAIETPEHVVVELELAGLGSRLAAATVDAFVLGVLYWVLGTVLGAVERHGGAALSWVVAIGILLAFALTWGYFLLFEALNRGRTPGKMAFGIRVVMETGHPVTFTAAAVRNLVRIADAMFFFFIGLLLVLFHPHNKRLGDMVAGTIVVRDRPTEVSLASAAPAEEPEPIEPGIPELDEDEFRLLSQVLARLEALAPERRRVFLDELVRRFAPRFPRRDADPLVFLTQLHEDERQKRRGRFATRAGPGAGHTRISAERFVGRKQAGWERFRAAAIRVERLGLTSLAASELLDFAARYRETAADLARARTYGVDARVIEYLERIVATGHNAVYGLRGFRRRRFAALLLREFPAAVVQARAYVFVAFLLFAVPAVAGYTLLRQRPEAAYELLPDGMIARAEAGAANRAEGIGYAQAPSPFLPLMASSIVANNVQVAFGAFALGVTAGVGTIVLVVFNGLFFGAVVGLFANYHLTGWLLTFVAGHGVLELTAIFIAAGAGLLVGRALVAPGDLTRHDALIIHGRMAIRLVGAATTLLVLAGTIEGFLSASDQPSARKLAVSAASLLLLALYLLNGWRHRSGPANVTTETRPAVPLPAPGGAPRASATTLG